MMKRRNGLRPVKYFDYDGQVKNGYFHEFAYNFVSREDVNVGVTVETERGTIVFVRADNIEFLDVEEEGE